MSNQKIPLFVPTFNKEKCLEEISECLDKGWTGIGFKTIEFENQFTKYISEPFGHFVNSNTSGIHLLLEMLKIRFNWPSDSEIISTPLTFVSSNHAILHANLKVVFADVNDSLCITPETIINNISEKTKAVIFVSIGGNSNKIIEISKLCKERGLILILDAAHACGSKYKGHSLSYYADYSIYSFQAVKNLPTADSGLVTTRAADEDALLRKLSWCGINKDTYSRSQEGYKWLYSVDYVGYKYHGNSIMASIALAQLPTIDQENERRREISKIYDSKLSKNSNIKLIEHENYNESSRHLYQIQTKNRDGLISFLEKQGIGTGVHYRSNTHYKMYKNQYTPFANSIDSRIITLPLHLRMTDNDAIFVADKILEFCSIDK